MPAHKHIQPCQPNPSPLTYSEAKERALGEPPAFRVWLSGFVTDMDFEQSKSKLQLVASTSE